MALDGIYTYFLVKELNETISNTRVESISLDGLIFSFSLYKQKVRSHLAINLNASYSSLYLTKQNIQKKDTSNFLYQLKRYLEGGILNSIVQYKSDRVVELYFTVYDFIHGPIKRKLIFEAMGRHSNLYLIEDNKIIDVYKKMFVLEGRHLIPNAQFEYFSSDKIDARNYQFDPLISPKDLTLKYLGISLRLAKYLNQNDIHPFDINVEPTLSLDENKSYFFNIFEGKTIKYSTLSEALENRIMASKDLKSPYKNFISNQLKRIDKKQVQLKQQLEQAEYMIDDKLKGDHIYASGLDLNSKLGWVDHIALDETISLSDNAQNYYKSYHKGKRAINYINQELDKVYIEKQIFDNFMHELELTDANDLNDFKMLLIPFGYLKQKPSKNQKHNHKIKVLTVKDETSTYIIGKNALQNAHIINNLANSNDYWFHVKDAPGSHVLVRTQNLNEKVIRTAAILAAYFSSLNQSSSIPVNYTLFKYVSKIGGRPASFVKIKNEKTIFIDILVDDVNKLIENA
ncbi:Rqc2 family fibronectin-binding protein [Acholeplasma granularum]|uniref:Rqc2 family fibronectin-binding protein n=1 Tax=Acholeplasma granularum TaxID=264635 RepID=UPI00046ECF59|nr:NFACT RNA binding domain-containing protein [Acholeplasma granularum]